MDNWREYTLGDIIQYTWNEFDGSGSLIGMIITKESDHAIVKVNDMNLWLDDTNQYMFKKINH